MAADTFQLKRGTTAQVNAYVAAIGEPVLDVTLKQLHMGDGTTAGGTVVGTLTTAYMATLLDDPTAAAARTTLGLGSAALDTSTTSTTDLVQGHSLKVGDLGLGNRIDISGTDLNALFTDGRYVHNAVPGATNSPIAAAAGYLDVSSSVMLISGSIRYEQMWRQLGVNNSYRRTWNGTVWSAWNAIVYEGSVFTNLTLVNSWVVQASRRAVYRKFGDSLQLELQVVSGTATDGTTIGTLPAGFRPPNDLNLPVVSGPNTTPSTTVTTPSIRITASTGVIACFNCTSATGIFYAGTIPLV